MSLAEAILRRVDDGRPVTFLGDQSQEVGRRQLWDEALRAAGGLATLGMGPGSRICILAGTSRETAAVLVGSWIIGGTTSVLPPPYRVRDLASYVAASHHRLAAVGADLVVLGPEYEPFGTELAAGVRAVTAADHTEHPTRHPGPAKPGPDDLAIVQFSSGSTGEPRPLALTHQAVLANVESVTERAGFGPHDTFATWLPLFHDMGLVGTFLVPLATGAALATMDTSRFSAQPHRWMRMVSDQQATICCGPNSAYPLAIRTLQRDEGLDLSQLRIAFNGAEPIQPDVVRDFGRAGAAHGLRDTAVQCVYGMAEATLAIAFPDVGGLRTFSVDPVELELGNRIVPIPPGADPGSGRALVGVGSALPRMEIRVGEPGTPDGCVDEISFRGPSTYAGTLHGGRLSRLEAEDGWVSTGDVGGVVDGQLVLCGRRKDIVIVGGRNLHPDQVEHAVERVDGVRLGNVAAFGVPRHGTEGLVVFAETRAPSTALRREIAAAALASVGVAPIDVRLLEPGTLPKTSSGKVRRQVARRSYLEESDG